MNRRASLRASVPVGSSLNLSALQLKTRRSLIDALLNPPPPTPALVRTAELYKERFSTMRDPSRIERMLASVKAIWELVPDLRLGQLVENAARYADWEGRDIFYIEDDRMQGGLDKFLTTLLEQKPSVTTGNAE